MDLSIGEVARRSGLSVHALRFYEREGLFANPVRRLSNGRRVYHEEDLEWLAVCTKLRSSGMSLEAIRQYVELARQGPGNEHERLALLRRHEKDVEARIQELNEALNVMRYKVGIYEDHLARGEADQLWNPSHSDTAPPAGPERDRRSSGSA
ncbi:MerR family transcriptional regulator [Streptomyces californicus]|uniref:MerR family transcriptional regulator n=1 Tax=Streptomyces californicus TaxID=67351 RepID=A0ABD7CWY0_9ACTN|nr:MULTISPECIES: MerR family transcriptional regulator [Streptomyces]QRV29502.1 MerR family transcriptional regulator [Streptomyces californicus]QRV34890.1 MerR family transcriptional regulator [Streptomyces californicus]QRV42918.1 MerR family transcriptional regulator [Streptomyces californicus]QRV49604.1 MerR family transcriptional regulator [Streptomyces californicus]